MPRNGKKPYRSARYGCAEDLCDPYESSQGASAEADAPKARSRAVRLMDELGGDASLPTVPKGREMRLSVPSAEQTAYASPAAPAVLSVKPSGEGDVVAVVLILPSDAGASGAGASDAPASGTPASEKVRLYLLVEQYADLRPREGSISPEDAEALLEAGRFCAAVKRGMRLLQYGDQSARRLAYKLTAKGIDRETADAAAAYLAQKGYIHEDDTARLRAEQGVRKLWGPRRIREDLRANGFAPDAVAEAMESVSEVDFEENCATVIRKKYHGVPEDRTERQKLFAALARLGYDADVIREAMRRVEREG